MARLIGPGRGPCASIEDLCSPWEPGWTGCGIEPFRPQWKWRLPDALSSLADIACHWDEPVFSLEREDLQEGDAMGPEVAVYEWSPMSLECGRSPRSPSVSTGTPLERRMSAEMIMRSRASEVEIVKVVAKT